MRQRDLRPLFAPRSLAVVGASSDPAKWGHALARGALRGAHRRDVYLVNRAGGEILGARAYRSLGDLPAPPELVVLSVPAAALEDTVEEALAAGARALVAISAGLGETGDEGRAREDALAARVREAGAVLLGPNCLGVADTGEELDVGWSELPAGSIGLLSQSGNLALEIARLAGDAGLGFSRFASLGNQADVGVAELVDELAAHEPTRVLALYVEDFRDGRAFVAAAARARASGTPVVLLAGGVSRAGAQAALSHTGALVSDDAVVDAACRAAGVVRVATPAELVLAAGALLGDGARGGRRVAVFGDGGGHGIVAADLLTARGLDVPPLPDEVAGRLRELLPARSVVSNPLDLAGAGEERLVRYAQVARALASAEAVDALLLTGYFGGYGVDSPERIDEELEAARALGEVARSAGRPLVVHTLYPEEPPARVLRETGAVVRREIEEAVGALAALAAYGEGAAWHRRSSPALAQVAAPKPGYAGARAFAREAGIELVEGHLVGTLEEAAAAARALGYPVALKATGLLHKSDAGGVVLGLASEEALAAAFADLDSRLGPGERSVEHMAPLAEGIELIVGVRRDPRFGPVALVGLGGVYAEVVRDTAVALAPLDDDEAAELVRRLRGAALLEGTRGGEPLDVAAAARALAALSRHAAACPGVAEVEVNPLLVLPQGALALDARVVLS